MLTSSILIASLCLLVSAFLSMSETAITGVSRSWLLQKEQQGGKRARLLSKLLSKPTVLITSLLVGNNFANILFTTIVTSFAIREFGANHILVISISVTAIILVFAEILPKTSAFPHANRISLIITPMIYVIATILKPISYIFLIINNLIVRIFAKNSSAYSPFAGSVDNLRGAIEMLERGDDEAETIKEEKAMLHGILDLSDLQAIEIMNHRKNVMCININDTTENIVKNLLDCNYTRVPVYRNSIENIIGILNVKTVYKHYMGNFRDVDISKLIQPAYFIPDTTYVIDVLLSFRTKSERMALVVDEYGSFLGILTLGDIMDEITGELQNKGQRNISKEYISSDNSIIVGGDLTIRDLNRKMNWDLPDEEFTTVAGLVLYNTGTIPNIGTVFSFYGFKFEILEKRRQQLMKIKVDKL